MSIVFAKPVSETKTAISLFVIRIGMAFAFLWAGSGKVADPAGFGMMLQNMVGFEAELAVSMAMMIGVFELVSGIFVLIGFLTRPAVIFQIIILIGAMAMFGFDFTIGPGIWKDPVMLGVAIGLAIYGSGKFGIDTIISDRLRSRK